jgi:hypothetical protein
MPEVLSLLQEGKVEGVIYERYAFPFSCHCEFCEGLSRAGVRREGSNAYQACCPVCWNIAIQGKSPGWVPKIEEDKPAEAGEQ